MEIECVFENAPWAHRVPKQLYSCVIKSCNITDRGSEIALFKGDHEAEKSNNSVKALLFENTKVHYIPRNLMKIFPNLVILSIYKCELKEVSAEDLIGLEKLEDLYLKHNHVTALPEDLFKNMTNLKEVSFSGNLIQQFDPKILKKVENAIEFFAIQRNPGIDEVFNKKDADVGDFIERLELLNSKKIDSKRFGSLFTSGKYSDFTIKVQDKEYKVYKGILASLSSVFDKMFSEDAAATSKTFDNMTNSSRGAVEEFLRYFYSRAAPSKENATEVLELAVEFDVPDLKLKCETILVRTMEPQVARRLYNLAAQESLPALKRKAFKAIQERYPEITEYIYDKPKFVNQLIDARDEFHSKKMKL